MIVRRFAKELAEDRDAIAVALVRLVTGGHEYGEIEAPGKTGKTGKTVHTHVDRETVLPSLPGRELVQHDWIFRGFEDFDSVGMHSEGDADRQSTSAVKGGHGYCGCVLTDLELEKVGSRSLLQQDRFGCHFCPFGVGDHEASSRALGSRPDASCELAPRHDGDGADGHVGNSERGFVGDFDDDRGADASLVV